MAQSIKVLLSFIHGRLQKLLDFRHDPVVSEILTKERISLWTYIERIHTQYAAKKEGNSGRTFNNG